MLRIIDKFLVDIILPDTTGEPLTMADVATLNNLWLAEVNKQLKGFINSIPDVTSDEVHEEAARIQRTTILRVLENPADKLLEAEALAIVKERLTAELAALGLPPPENITINPALANKFREQARRRLEAKLRAGIELITGD